MAGQSTDTRLAVIENQLGNIEADVKHIDEQISQNYVTRIEYSYLKRQVYLQYGFLTALVLALVGLALKVLFGGK